MKRSTPNSLNKKIQNGSKNPILGKEFTPNGVFWVGYDADPNHSKIVEIPVRLYL